MKNRLGIVLIMLWITVSFFVSCSKKTVTDKSEIVLAEEFIMLLKNGDYAKATERYDMVMKVALPSNQLKKAWEDNYKKYGEFQNIESQKTEISDKHVLVNNICNFEKGRLNVRVVFNPKKEVSGLWFLKPETAGGYKLPSYARAESYKEEEVKFGQKEWELPGTLTLPAGEGPFPCVILVHGSGPNNRDESIGPNKPFKDLATGLASKGVAVLRYDKRTLIHGLKMKEITTRTEVLDDVNEAVKFLQKDKRIDKIIILGHSLGGTLVPRIREENPNMDGFIIMAGATRPLEDLIEIQTRYIFSLDGKIDEEEKAKLKEIEELRQEVKNLSSEPEKSKKDYLGAPVSYWMDLRDYKPHIEAGKITEPLLIIQGGRDYQVTEEDYNNFKDELQEKKNVTFKFYPSLNHLFIAGEGVSKPEEYSLPGHVDEQVVNDIADWVQGLQNNK
ncbi:MAG: DUF3887 domain-containing protein [Vulcanimicrobiota bacterium]